MLASRTGKSAALGLLSATAIGLVCLFAPSAGRSAQSVSIQSGTLLIAGNSGGDHVRIRMSPNGKGLVIRGYIRHRARHSCRRKRHRKVVRCAARRVGAVVADLGGGGDKLEVLDTLPVPVTAFLGPGRDKMIGSGEPDVCYQGGTDRNRCIGGGGNDVCIGGPGNGDCVGGRGNDLCEVHAGSDGCWGGPGRDLCKMGPGKDGCHGNGGADTLFGGSSPDKLVGGPGPDYCDGGRGRGRSHSCESGPRR